MNSSDNELAFINSVIDNISTDTNIIPNYMTWIINQNNEIITDNFSITNEEIEIFENINQSIKNIFINFKNTFKDKTLLAKYNQWKKKSYKNNDICFKLDFGDFFSFLKPSINEILDVSYFE